MYIGHYKSVSSSKEFFSSRRETLDFPTQLEYMGERYSLFRTLISDTPSKFRDIVNAAKKYGIPFDIKVGI